MQGFHPEAHGKKKPVKNYANGGPVNGPGTGTSDDVEAEVRPGSYVMPADTVDAAKGFNPGMRQVALSNGENVLTPEKIQAIGAGVLNMVKSMTHESVGAGGMDSDGDTDGSLPGEVEEDEAIGGEGAQGGMKYGFADGGLVDDEKRRRNAAIGSINTAVQAKPQSPWINGSPPTPRPAAQPPAVSGFVSSMERNQRALDASTASGPVVPATKVNPVNPTDVQGWRTKAVMDGAAEDAQSAWDRGQVGQAAGAVARGAITAIPTAIGEFGYNTVAPIAGAAKGFWNGLTGGSSALPEAQAAPATAPVSPTAANKTPAQQGATNPATASTAPVTPAAPAAAGFNPEATGNVNARRQANGVMEFSGQNVAGDVSYSGASGFKPSGAGVSAQNMGAADQLSAKYAAQRTQPAQPAVQQAQGFIPQDTGGYGLMDKNRLAVREAQMNAQQLKPGAGSTLRSILQQQAAQPSQQIDRERMASDNQFRGQELAMRGQENQAAQGFRAGQLANDGQRLNLEGQKFASDQEVRGFDVAQARRIEDIRKKYDAATDPSVKNQLSQQLQAMAGGAKPTENKFTVVPGGQEWDATAGVMRNVPARVLNNQTGQFVDGGQEQQAMPMPKEASQMKAGAIYQTGRGPAKWDGKQFIPV